MQKAVLLSLALIANSSAALAATPIFQLHENDARAQLRAIDVYPSKPERDTILPDMKMPSHSASASRGGAFISNVVYNVGSNGDGSDIGNAPSADSGYADYSDTGGGPAANSAGAATLSSATNADESLFYFLKNFKARPLQKPASGTMLLVGLCFVLYQMRRRPMRSSIGFNIATKLIDRHAA